MWDRTNETDLGRRVAELESQTVDLRRRVAELASRVQVPSDVRYAPVDDHREPAPGRVRASDVRIRDVRKQAPMMVCELAETCVQTRCQSRVSHPLRDNCTLSCWARDGDEGRCIPVPAEPAPVQMMICSAPCVDRPQCMHLHPHLRSWMCLNSSCGYHDGTRCQPVPASPEVAIPDVPVAVGTEAFREALGSQARDLSDRYRWAANAGLTITMRRHGIDYLERLADVACTLRDAYDLARIGEQEQAQEKLEEIEW